MILGCSSDHGKKLDGKMEIKQLGPFPEIFFSDLVGLGRVYIYYAVDFLLHCVCSAFLIGSQVGLDAVNLGNNSSLKITGPRWG